MSFKLPNENRVHHPLGMDAFVLPYNGQNIFCIASIDGGAWEHVSVTISYRGKQPKRCPAWDEMCLVKNLFWDDDDEVIQFHPKKSTYVNLHPFCLHLWRPVNGDLKLPEFNE